MATRVHACCIRCMQTVLILTCQYAQVCVCASCALQTAAATVWLNELVASRAA